MQAPVRNCGCEDRQQAGACDPKWLENGNLSCERAGRLPHFEALELSYVVMMFLVTFWKVPNPETTSSEKLENYQSEVEMLRS